MALDEEYYGIQDLSPHGRRVHVGMRPQYLFRAFFEY